MKKLIVVFLTLVLLSSCASVKSFKMTYKVIEIVAVDHVDDHGIPVSYDAVIQIDYNYYSALITDKGKIIYIGEIVGNKKDGIEGED